MYIWLIRKNEIIRGRELWKKESLTITNTDKKLKEFKKYELPDKLEKLKELCNEFHQ